jgi:hypothetical protein
MVHALTVNVFANQDTQEIYVKTQFVLINVVDMENVMTLNADVIQVGNMLIVLL